MKKEVIMTKNSKTGKYDTLFHMDHVTTKQSDRPKTITMKFPFKSAGLLSRRAFFSKGLGGYRLRVRPGSTNPRGGQPPVLPRLGGANLKVLMLLLEVGRSFVGSKGRPHGAQLV